MAVDARKLRLGSVVWVRLDPVKGREIGKERPCIVHQRVVHPQGTVTVLPLTMTAPPQPYPFMAQLRKGAGGLKKDSWVKCQQVRTVAVSRLTRHVGNLKPAELAPVTRALLFHLGVGS